MCPKVLMKRGRTARWKSIKPTLYNRILHEQEHDRSREGYFLCFLKVFTGGSGEETWEPVSKTF